MKRSDIDKSFHSVMKGFISMKTINIKKYTICSSSKYKTESITQAKDYGKLE